MNRDSIRSSSAGNLLKIIPDLLSPFKSKLNFSDPPEQIPYSLSFSCCSLMILLVSSASRFWCINSWRSCSRRCASLCFSSSVMKSSFPCNQHPNKKKKKSVTWESHKCSFPRKRTACVTHKNICHYLPLLSVDNALWKTTRPGHFTPKKYYVLE